MCGLAGILTAGAVDPALLARMAGSIAHRGPDGEGIWRDDEAGIGFAHRRLAIVDLSPSGHQPMHSADGRWVLAYNGEIYNHAALRRKLEQAGGGPAATGQPWRGHSDTETLLEAIAFWGLKRALEESAGMFALALWDRRERRLSLARDRFGEKPLYYGWTGGDFMFGSELKTIRAHPRFANEIDRGALRLLFARAYIPAPRSIYRGLYKLVPGRILSVSAEAARLPLDRPPYAGDSGWSLEPYWSYSQVVADGLRDPIRDEGEALDRLEQALAAAIQGQAVADVPVGAFLSGGIDSSTVVALYRKYTSSEVRTYTIGFEEARFNEAEHARVVARHFGTDHHERTVTPSETRDVIPLLPRMYDEPFADSSQIPTHLVSRFAREGVTVALSGDGGDELFGGYERHVTAPARWSHYDRIPAPLRSAAARGLGWVPARAWDRLMPLLPGATPASAGTKLRKNLRVMGGANSFEQVYETFLDEWSGEASPVLGARSTTAGLDLGSPAPDAIRAMYHDAVNYLPDDILCKVDRASMAVSLETRAPFLDHRVAQVAARIPLHMKIGQGGQKSILKSLLYRHAPRALFDRPKAGFSIPIGQWIKGPLRPWAEELLDRRTLVQQGYLDADAIHRRWRQHLRGERDAEQSLWAVLMFQAWLAESSGSGTASDEASAAGLVNSLGT